MKLWTRRIGKAAGIVLLVAGSLAITVLLALLAWLFGWTWEDRKLRG